MGANNTDFQNHILVHRGVANLIPGVPDDGSVPKSTFDIHKELDKGVGVHWSSDPDVAKNFALDDQGFPTPKTIGVVYHGSVSPEHVWNHSEPDSLEYHDDRRIYHPGSDEHGEDYGEKEVTVKEGRPVTISGMDVYRDDPFWKEPTRLSVQFDTPFRDKA